MQREELRKMILQNFSTYKNFEITAKLSHGNTKRLINNFFDFIEKANKWLVLMGLEITIKKTKNSLDTQSDTTAPKSPTN
jgi:hypothetical protein